MHRRSSQRSRVAREGKERRRHWAQRKTRKIKRHAGHEGALEVSETEPHQETHDTEGMLPSSIVNLLAAREKQVFHSDSEDDRIDVKPTLKRKKRKNSGVKPVLLNEIPPAQCLHNSMEFLKKRKMQVSRSSSVLKNSNQALRLLSTSGLLTKNSSADSFW
ncbi:UDP-N-acetylmuramoyl-L-alanyl-D-glutamate-2, 6-diaminopimelate ligase isoform X2 [Tasmannia lanceolata]|uniref:UDP-N-acetylmuramoyl-L-alanyl-D-glutamate-2, 6-diaminopimelate ligase isoform X2 n=1 Tax=Tasmannia lanceolata TaxID=3420 RepID=UPI004063A293